MFKVSKRKNSAFGSKNEANFQSKSSHLYLYSAFNNTNCNKATAQYQNRKIVSQSCKMTRFNEIFRHFIIEFSDVIVQLSSVSVLSSR